MTKQENFMRNNLNAETLKELRSMCVKLFKSKRRYDFNMRGGRAHRNCNKCLGEWGAFKGIIEERNWLIPLLREVENFNRNEYNFLWDFLFSSDWGKAYNPFNPYWFEELGECNWFEELCDCIGRIDALLSGYVEF